MKDKRLRNGRWSGGGESRGGERRLQRRVKDARRMGGEGYSPAEKDAAVRREAWDIAAEAAALWAVVHRRWWLEWRPWLE